MFGASWGWAGTFLSAADFAAGTTSASSSGRGPHGDGKPGSRVATVDRTTSRYYWATATVVLARQRTFAVGAVPLLALAVGDFIAATESWTRRS